MSYSVNTPYKFVIIHLDVSNWFNNDDNKNKNPNKQTNRNLILIFSYLGHNSLYLKPQKYTKNFQNIIPDGNGQKKSSEQHTDVTFTNTCTNIPYFMLLVHTCVCTHSQIHQLFQSLYISSTNLYKVFPFDRWMWEPSVHVGHSDYWEDGWGIPGAWRIR